MTTAALTPVRAASTPSADVVLVRPCDGYPAGTHGRLLAVRQGCAVLTPDATTQVAGWARPRRTLWVPLRSCVVA